MNTQQVVQAIVTLNLSDELMNELDQRTPDELCEILDELEKIDDELNINNAKFGIHSDNLGYLLIHCGYYNGKRYPVNTYDLPPANSECFAECCFSQGVIYTNINDIDRLRCYAAHDEQYGCLTALMRLRSGEDLAGCSIKVWRGIELVSYNP